MLPSLMAHTPTLRGLVGPDETPPDIIVLPVYDAHSNQWLCVVVDKQRVPLDGDMVVCEEDAGYFRSRYRASVPISGRVALRGVSRGVFIPE